MGKLIRIDTYGNELLEKGAWEKEQGGDRSDGRNPFNPDGHKLGNEGKFDRPATCMLDRHYLGPPEMITHDAGKNFISKDFKTIRVRFEYKDESSPN